MERFEDFLGQDDIKEFFREAGNGKHPGHAYILEGSDGMGKKSLAKLFAMSLLCTSEGEKPCGACHSCKMALAGTHPDFITVTHEKLNTLRVSEIRQQVVDDVPIKPYYGGKKVYIIPDAQKMNKEAQNSLLKTIEEPPDYAVLLLLTDSKDSLLPTVTSRCVSFSFRPLPDSIIKKYLTDKLDIEPARASAITSFSGGNLGMAIRLSQSEEFREIYDNTTEMLKTIENRQVEQLLSEAKEYTEHKEDLDEILDIMLLWYRDVLMCKAAPGVALTFTDETGYIETKAAKISYEEINRSIAAIEETKERLALNANAEAAMDMLLLNIKGY